MVHLVEFVTESFRVYLKLVQCCINWHKRQEQPANVVAMQNGKAAARKGHEDLASEDARPDRDVRRI